MMAQVSFYVVWNPDGRNPTVRHGDHQTAEREANRLARENPGCTFFVLAATYSAKLDSLQTTRYRIDEIPF